MMEMSCIPGSFWVMIEGEMVSETDRWINAERAVMWTTYRTITAKREPSLGLPLDPTPSSRSDIYIQHICRRKRISVSACQ